METIKAHLPYSMQTIKFKSPEHQYTHSLSKNQKTQTKKERISNVIQFQHSDYPFLNQYPINPKIYKTQLILPIQLSKFKNKINKINHPNIINVKQVQERHISKNNNQKQIVFDLIYQEVPFSIKYIGFGERNSSALYKKTTEVDLRDILNKVSIHLMKMAINRVIRLTEIGVTQSGVIKVFVPPQILLNNKQTLPPHAIFTNNYKLVSWWETTFNKETKQPRYSPQNSPKNLANMIEASKLQQSCKNQQKQERQNNSFLNINSYNRKFSRNWLESSNLQNDNDRLALKARKQSKQQSLQQKGEVQGVKQNIILKNSTKSYESDLSKLASLQVQKMKRIDRQIKQIKQRLVQRQKLKLQSADIKHLVQKSNQKLKQSVPAMNVLQMDQKANHLVHSVTKPQDQPVFRDSIQQNINCINIYHAPTPNINQFTPKKLMTYAKIPYPDPLDGISDQDSLDTYDIQFCTNQDPIVTKPISILPSSKYERQISQRNYKVKKDSLIQSRNKSSKHKNQVENRKFQTESAGPLQFKNFVNNYIKPQFLAKKSNIYEDPMEQESQHEPLPQKVHYNELAQAGRSVASKTHQSESTRKQTDKLMIKKHQNPEAQFFQQIPRVRSDINLGINFKQMAKVNQTSEGEVHFAQKKLQVRVHDILQKTKNAIAVLNRMKQGNGLMRKALSP